MNEITDGIDLCGRFAYKVNELKLCGPDNDYQLFLKYHLDGSFKNELRTSFSRYQGLPAYLKIIGEKIGKDFLHPDVVRAYFIGNDYLLAFDKDDMIRVVDTLVSRGLPRSYGEHIKTIMPNGYVPHHNFHVLYVGPGQTSGNVETTHGNMDKCMISWGKVQEVLEDKLVVKRQHLALDKNKKIYLDKEVSETISYVPQFMNPKKNDTVGIHWDVSTIVFTPQEAEQLKKYTKLIIDIRNKTPDLHF